MRSLRIAALLWLLVAAAPSYAADCDTIVGWVGVPLCQTAAAPADVEVPNVIGEASYAAADAILEGVTLDAGAETEHCSAAANNEVTDQTPSAGTMVPPGTLVALGTSNGVACKGFPPLWLYTEIER